MIKRLLIIHTYYQKPGGEDVVFNQEVDLLRKYGHEVQKLEFYNEELSKLNNWEKAVVAVWNNRSYQRVREQIRLFRPDLVHIHNTFPLASPAIIKAIKNERVPVVMTLHNYRLMCLNALLFRDGRVCESCIGKLPVSGIVHKCYRGRMESSVVALMLATHRLSGTWADVDSFITLSQFARKKFIRSGMPAEKIMVKPNFVHPDPGIGQGGGRYAIYVGRLSKEKGIRTLLEAWKYLENVPLKIIGEGPLSEEVKQRTVRSRNVEWIGQQPRNKVLDFIGGASVLIFPSEWYETFPMVIIESLAKGTPIIAANLGSAAEIIKHHSTGLLFKAGDASDLVEKVEWCWKHPDYIESMRQNARLEFETKYSAEINYEILIGIYRKVLGL